MRRSPPQTPHDSWAARELDSSGCDRRSLIGKLYSISVREARFGGDIPFLSGQYVTVTCPILGLMSQRRPFMARSTHPSTTGLGGDAFTVTSVAWPIFTARVTTTFMSSVAPHAAMNGPWTSGAPS